jgi:glycosyltransferase involved in cell wall biosynthesis
MFQLTIAVLTRNDENHLPQLLQSIQRQTNLKFNLTILDNGSTDATPQLIESFDFSSTEILKLTNLEDTTEANGMKILFEKSNTPYISIVHGDDLLKPNYVNNVLAFIAKNPNFDAVTQPIEHFFDSNGEIQNRKTLITKSNLTQFKLLNRLLVCGINPGLMPGSLFKRDSILLNNLLETIPNFTFNFDIVFWSRFSRCKLKLLRSNSCQYIYRRHTLQSSSSIDNDSNLAIARNLNYKDAPTFFEKLLVQSGTFKESTFADNSHTYLSHLEFSYLSLTPGKLFIGKSINFFLRQSAILINKLLD